MKQNDYANVVVQSLIRIHPIRSVILPACLASCLSDFHVCLPGVPVRLQPYQPARLATLDSSLRAACPHVPATSHSLPSLVLSLLCSFNCRSDFFLRPENYKSCSSLLVQRFGELVRRLGLPDGWACGPGGFVGHRFMPVLAHLRICAQLTAQLAKPCPTTHYTFLACAHHSLPLPPPVPGAQDVEPTRLQGPGVAPRVHAGGRLAGVGGDNGDGGVSLKLRHASAQAGHACMACARLPLTLLRPVHGPPQPYLPCPVRAGCDVCQRQALHHRPAERPGGVPVLAGQHPAPRLDGRQAQEAVRCGKKEAGQSGSAA